jgi:hypothetical protein
MKGILMFAFEVALAVLIPAFIAYVIYRVLRWRKAKKELEELDQRIAALEIDTTILVWDAVGEVLSVFAKVTKERSEDTEANLDSDTATR